MKKITILSLFLFWIFITLAWCSNKSVENLEPQEDNGNIAMENSNNDEYEEMTTTMEALFKEWGKKTCEFEFSEDNIIMKWIVYIDGETVKTETELNFWGNVIQWHTLVNDDYTYTRDNTSGEAWKISNDDEDYDDEDESYDDEDYDDEDMENIKTNFKCKKGIADKSVFNLPKNVEFKEFNDMAGLDYLDDLDY